MILVFRGTIAVFTFSDAMALNPARAAAQFAQAYQQALRDYNDGRYAEALSLSQKKLLPLSPRHAEVLNLAGSCSFMLGKHSLSENYYRQAIAVSPDAQIWFNLALSISAQSRAADTERAYRECIALDPGHFRALNNLGNLLIREGSPSARAAAIDCYRRALAVSPNYAEAHANLGFALEASGNKQEAEKHYRQCLAANPAHAGGLTNLAWLLENTGRPVEALACYQRILLEQPQATKSIVNVLGLRRQLCDWQPDDSASPEALLAALHRGAPEGASPLILLSLPEFDGAMQREAARRFARSRLGMELALPPLVASAVPVAGRRLKIGYLSADFRDHPVTHLLSDVVAAHDRERFEIALYAYGPVKEDAYRQRLRSLADRFHDLAAMGEGEAAALIANDGVDILVDLTGYTSHARLEITARRPAPVIVSWLGFIGSLGEPRLSDYVIGDPVATPLELAGNFSESLALMPRCFQPNRAFNELPPPPSRQEEGLPEKAVVFCSFNQSFKFNPILWDDWCAILTAVPDSVLWLAPPTHPESADNLRRETQARGVSPDRLVFARRQPLETHLARVALADIALDTFPYNSGTTASDVLRASVPLLTRMGGTFVSRMAGSLLSAAGLQELIAHDRAAYIALAVRLATDEALRVTTRLRVKEAVQASTLFQPDVFCRDLESLFLRMHAQALAGKRDHLLP